MNFSLRAFSKNKKNFWYTSGNVYVSQPISPSDWYNFDSSGIRYEPIEKKYSDISGNSWKLHSLFSKSEHNVNISGSTWVDEGVTISFPGNTPPVAGTYSIQSGQASIQVSFNSDPDVPDWGNSTSGIVTVSSLNSGKINIEFHDVLINWTSMFHSTQKLFGNITCR